MTDGYRRGLTFFLLTMVVFASQDGISKLLAEDYPPMLVVMIRYWAFAALVLAVSAGRPGGVPAAARTRRPWIQVLRGLLLVFQIVIMTYSFAILGLAESHAIMSIYPLMIAALGAWLLGERVDGGQWAAIGVGFIGVLIILQPGGGVFDANALFPLLAALMFAIYGVLTRWVGQSDKPSVSFFYTGVAGAVGVTLIGPFFWEPMTAEAWIWMAALCVTGATGHYLLIKAYETVEASAVQPFAYLQLVLASIIGVVVFGETLDAPLLIGAAVVVAAGLFTLLRARRAQPAR